MRTPEALETLVEYGIIEEVLRPLMSGKEAQIYLVISGGERRVAKVYKEAQDRSFKQRAEYTDGRKSRNSRDARAMAKHSRHGKAQDEAAWRSAEVNAIYRLNSAGVRVPTPYHFVDGVLVMELVTDAQGDPAPRLGDLEFDPGTARRVFDHLLVEVIRMLCAGVVHGDLSEFNVLLGADGPVVIDFPQAVDPANNQSARKLLIRDVDNLHRFLSRFVRGGHPPPYAQEMWDLYQSNLLTPETVLRGRHVSSQRVTNTADVLAIIGDAERDHRRRQARESGQGPRGPRPPMNGPERVTTPAAQEQRGPQGPQANRGPQGADNRGPRDDNRGPQGADQRGPREGFRGPQGADNRGPRGADNRGPRGADNRGPRGADNRGPQGADNRGPQGADNRGPREDNRGPRGADHRGPQGADNRGPREGFRGADNRGPRVEVRGESVAARGPQSPGPRGPKVEVQMTPPDGRGREPRGAAPVASPGPRGDARSEGGGASRGEGEGPRRRRRGRGGGPSGEGSGSHA